MFFAPKDENNKFKSHFLKLAKIDITAPFFIFSFLLISFLAGILGGLLVNNYEEKCDLSYQNISGRTLVPEISVGEIKSQQLNQSLVNSVVSIYLAKTLGADLLSNTYSPFELKGSGLILTNDGWIMTNRRVIEGELTSKYVIITANGNLFSLEKIVADKATDIVFAKIKSEAKIENLSAVLLAESSEQRSGDDLFSLNSLGRTATGKVLNLANYYFNSKEDLIQSTEKFTKIILLAGKGYDQSMVGAAVFNLKGEVEGLVMNINNNEVQLLPIYYLKSKTDQLFKDKEIKRNYLGVNYLDLSSTYLFDKKIIGFNQGALVVKTKSKPAVIKNSPADKAGIKENDLILEVEKEPLTRLQSLTELIQQYKEGSEVTLKIKRGEKIINLAVKLEIR